MTKWGESMTKQVESMTKRGESMTKQGESMTNRLILNIFFIYSIYKIYIEKTFLRESMTKQLCFTI